MMKRKSIFLLALALSLGIYVAPARAERTDNLVKAVAKEAGVNEEQAEKEIAAVFSAVQSELEAGREGSIRKFGRFWIQERTARQGRNPKTGAAISIPAKKYPKFASSDLLKNGINPNVGTAVPVAQAPTPQ